MSERLEPYKKEDLPPQRLRECEVDGRIGYFHMWEHYAEPVAPSPMVGGIPGGQYSRVFAIVEFEGSVKRVPVDDIRFVDDIAVYLSKVNKAVKEMEEFYK